MPLWVPRQGQEIVLDLMLAVGYTLKLYTNDVTAGLTDAQIHALTEASFTEATFTGYSAKTLTGGSWVTTQADPSTGTYAQQTFTRSLTGTAQIVYGWYLIRTSDSKLVSFERFSGPITVTALNDAIAVTPTITLDDDQEAHVAARGLLTGGYQILTASSSNYVAVDANTDMTLTGLATDSSRVYRIHYHSHWVMNGPGIWHAFATIDGADTFRMAMPESNGDSQLLQGLDSSSVLWFPTTGTHTILMTVNNFNGFSTLYLYASADTPRMLWVEDVGPR